MTATRLHNWIVALWGLAGVLGASDLYLALKTPHGDLSHPSTEIRIASTHLLLAIVLVILYSPQRRRALIIVAAAVVVFAIVIGWAIFR
jgi:hypothetical protein